MMSVNAIKYKGELLAEDNAAVPRHGERRRGEKRRGKKKQDKAFQEIQILLKSKTAPRRYGRGLLCASQPNTLTLVMTGWFVSAIKPSAPVT